MNVQILSTGDYTVYAEPIAEGGLTRPGWYEVEFKETGRSSVTWSEALAIAFTPARGARPVARPEHDVGDITDGERAALEGFFIARASTIRARYGNMPE